VQSKILDIFSLGELDIVYMDWGACFSSCGGCDVDRLGDFDPLAVILQS
jgi:hypothetical protein